MKERRGYIVTSLPSFLSETKAAWLFLQKVPDLPEWRKILGMASSEECSNGTIIIDGSIMEGVRVNRSWLLFQHRTRSLSQTKYSGKYSTVKLQRRLQNNETLRNSFRKLRSNVTWLVMKNNGSETVIIFQGEWKHRMLTYDTFCNVDNVK